jgi:hypothetical protein
MTERHEALLKELEEAKSVYEAANKEWKRIHAYCLAVTAVENFFATTVDPDLTRIFDRVYCFLLDAARRSMLAGRPGARPRPYYDTTTLAGAAALIDVFAKQFGSIDRAIKKCSAVAGVDPIQLKSFRKNVRRGLLDELSTNLYLACVATAKTITLNKALDGLRKRSPQKE